MGVLARVLVVDDNVDAALAMVTLLQLWGFAVGSAHDGEAALAAIARDDPDVVLLDLGLPRLDGYSVRRAAEESPGHRTRRWLAITGYGQETDRVRTHEAGFDAHFVKPVEVSALRAVLGLPALPDTE